LVDHKEPEDQLVLKEIWERLDLEESLEIKDLRAPKDRLGPLDHKDLLTLLGQLDLKDLLDHKDLLELLDQLDH